MTSVYIYFKTFPILSSPLSPSRLCVCMCVRACVLWTIADIAELEMGSGSRRLRQAPAPRSSASVPRASFDFELPPCCTRLVKMFNALNAVIKFAETNRIQPTFASLRQVRWSRVEGANRSFFHFA